MSISRAALGLALAAAVAGVAAAQPPAKEGGEKAAVTYRGADGKIDTVTGVVKSSPGRIEVTAGAAKTTVSGPDILRFEPTDLAGVPAGELRTARTQLDAGDAAKALASFTGLAQKAGPNAPPATKGALAYMVARLTTVTADAKTGPEFDAAAKAALDEWAKVLPLARGSWEVWPAHATPARLQAEQNDFAAAAASYAALAATPGLPKELKAEAAVREAAMKLRGKQPGDIAAVIQPLEGDASLPPALRQKVAVLKAAAGVTFPAAPPASPPTGEAAAKLQAAIDAATDPAAKGLGYTALAELQLANGQPREAMWAYLWVDVVHNADHEDHVLAVARLAQLFDAMGDKERAEQFREKLTRIRGQ